MITAICLLWIGWQLAAPYWYYILIGVSVIFRFINAKSEAKRNRKIKEHLDTRHSVTKG